jgi:broad specificity phosphatase PhoE
VSPRRERRAPGGRAPGEEGQLTALAPAPPVAAVERRVHLVRHAEAEMVDAAGRMWSRDPRPLTARGRRQAAELRARFADVPVRRVHASDLPRARETAEALAGGRPVTLHPGLREIDLGDLEGRPADEALAAAPGFLVRPEVAAPGGESFLDVDRRAGAALEALLAEDPDETVVVVAHGAVNRALIGRLLGLDGAHALRLRQDWAGVSVLDRAAGRWWLAALNWTPLGLAEWAHTRPIGPLGQETWARLGR